MANFQSGVVSPRTGIYPTAKVDDQNNVGVRVGPYDVGAYGAYRASARSGALTGTGVIDLGPLFSVRWTDSTRLMVITYLKAVMNPTTKFTARRELVIDLVPVSGFTVADSAGTALTLTSSNKMRKTFPNSLVNDMRIAPATALTAGTRTVDANPIAISNPTNSDFDNVAAATTEIGSPPAQSVLLFQPNLANGEWPLILAANEGILVRNLVVFPAAGVATLTVELSWMEVTAYP